MATLSLCLHTEGREEERERERMRERGEKRENGSREISLFLYNLQSIGFGATLMSSFNLIIPKIPISKYSHTGG